MIKIDRDIIAFSDEQLNAALVLMPIALATNANKPKIKALLERRAEMMELERWTREHAKKLTSG